MAFNKNCIKLEILTGFLFLQCPVNYDFLTTMFLIKKKKHFYTQTCKRLNIKIEA